jgi:hypothetical protein
VYIDGVSAPPNAGRRLFLKQSLFSSAVMATAGVFPSAAFADQPGLLALSPKEFAVLEAWLERLVPAADGQPGARDVGLARKFDVEVANWSAQHQSDFKLVLGAFEDFPLLLSGFWGKFTQMDAATQDRYLEDWMDSGLQIKKQAFMVVKLVGMFLYYCQDESWPVTGYPGPFDPRFRAPEYRS